MTYIPDKWGPPNGIDSKDYVLYMEHPTLGITGEPVRLLGHSLTSPGQNLTDALQYSETVLRNGKVRTVSRTKRAAYATNRTYQVGFPSALWTPAMERTVKEGCTTTFMLYFQCIDDAMYDHVDILPDSTLSPAIEAEDVVQAGDETTILTYQSDMTVPEKIRQWALGFSIVYTATGVVLRDLAIMTEDCPGCDFVAGQGVLTVGSDGTAAPSVIKTDDRFSSVTAPTGYGVETDEAHAVFTEGDTVIVSVLKQGTPDVGELYVSRLRGSTPAKVANFTALINSFAKLGNSVIAAGETIAGAAKLFLSDDLGTTWTEVGGSVLTGMTAAGLNQVAVDKETGRAYIAADGGKLLVGRMVGSSMAISEVSGHGASSNNILSVAVLGRNHIIVGGAAGFCAESKDGGSTWTAVDVPGSDAVAAIGGNRLRTLFGAGTALYERSVLTKNAMKAIVLQDGQSITGNITRIVMGLEDNMNQFFVVTDDGEVAVGVGFYPGA
jgi:hypothetical protein